MTETLSFDRWLKQRRRALGFTQQDLAGRIGCSASTLEKLEAGVRRPSRQIAELLAGALGVAPAERATLSGVLPCRPALLSPPLPGLRPARRAILAGRVTRRGADQCAPTAHRTHRPRRGCGGGPRLPAARGVDLLTLAGPPVRLLPPVNA